MDNHYSPEKHIENKFERSKLKVAVYSLNENKKQERTENITLLSDVKDKNIRSESLVKLANTLIEVK